MLYLVQEKLETLEEHLKTILNDKKSLKLLIGQILDDIDFIDAKDRWGWYGHTFERIFCEFVLENTFYRKESKFTSYQSKKSG